MITKKNNMDTEIRESMRGGNGESHSIKCIGNEPLEMMAMIVLY